MPANCPESEPQASPTVFPDDANSIPPVTLAEVKFRLGGADNRADANLKTATFTVTVKAGDHIGSEISCLGNGTVELTTVPDSKAYQQIDCNVDAELASDLITEDDVVLTKDTTFTVTVTSTKATRWDVAVFGCSKPVGTCQA